MYAHTQTRHLHIPVRSPQSSTAVSAVCMFAATGLSQSGVLPSPSQEQLQEQAAQVAASAHSWRGSDPEQSDVLASVESQPELAQTSGSVALGATQQQRPADLGEADLLAALDALVDDALPAVAAAGSVTGAQQASELSVDNALAAAAATGSLVDDQPTLEAAVDAASAAAAAGSSTAVASTSSQCLRAQVPDSALLHPADQQQPPAGLAEDLAVSEAAVDSALAAAESLTGGRPQPANSYAERLRTQILDNALLKNPGEQQQPAGLIEDLAASEAAIDSALAAAANSFTASDTPQLHSSQYVRPFSPAVESALAAAADSLTASYTPRSDSSQYVRPLTPGSALLRAAQLQRQAIDNALAAAGVGDSMRSRGSELPTAEQEDLTSELAKSKAAVEAALAAASEGELAAAANTDWSTVQSTQGDEESALAPSIAPISQLSVEDTPVEAMTEDLLAAAQADLALASVLDDPVALGHFVAPADLSPMTAEHIKAAIAQGANLAPASDLTAEDITASAVQEVDQAVAPLKYDPPLSTSLADAAAEDIAAAAGEGVPGSGTMPQNMWTSGTQSSLARSSATSGPDVVTPPAELTQELAADLQEIQALRSQVCSQDYLLPRGLCCPFDHGQ